MSHLIRASLVARLVLVIAAGPAAAATIVVNSNADTEGNDGVCTLREAINSANTNSASGNMPNECAAGEAFPVVDTIAFAIPGSGVHTIMPVTTVPEPTLPDIVEAVVIDGYTQLGASVNTLPLGDDAKLLIEIDATMLGSHRLLHITANGTTIRGLVMNHMQSVGLQFDSSHNTITGNFFQTDPTGSTFEGGAGGSAQSMILLLGDSNMLGGTAPGDRNLIGGGSTTASGAVEIAGTGNTVQGNYFGVTADGSAALNPNFAVIAIDLGAYGPSTNTLIGGSVPGAGNVIFAPSFGINVAMGFSGDNTVIQGNIIGTDATGSYPLAWGSAVAGIQVYASKNTTIGGAAASAGNVISGNYNGIIVYADGPGTIIQGNRIGTDASGAHPVPNTHVGISVGSPGIEAGSNPSVIGGANPGEGNTIAYNCNSGIFFNNSSLYTQWPILGNSIHSNHNIGISLDSSPNPLANDAGDTDTGPNNLQNYPVIASALVASGSVNISGALSSTANTTFRIEFFSGIGCHVSGFGEGRHYLGSADVPTDAGGNVGFGGAMTTFPVPAGHSVFTATATDPDGNTSEFSQCFGTPELLFADDFELNCAGRD